MNFLNAFWRHCICERENLYNALYFGDARLPKTMSLFKEGSAKCIALSRSFPVWRLGPCFPTQKCICSHSALLEYSATYFRSLYLFTSLFLSSARLKEGVHFKSSATGPWSVRYFSFIFSLGWMHLVLSLSSHINIWPVTTCIVLQWAAYLGWAYLSKS